MNEPRIGSLFTGTGALDMAAHALFGGRTVWHSDVKPAAVALLAQRHPGVPNLGDLTAIDFRDVEPVDILTAGWPCQPHSSAGKRLGEADPRALWPHVARAIDLVRPAVFLGENVARIAANGELRRVARSLAEIGYVGTWRCVSASDVGAPHKRDRCFVVAVRADVAPDALSLELRDEPGRGRGQDGAGPGVAGHDGAAGPVRLTLLPTPAAQNVKGPARRLARKDGSPRTLAQTNLPGAIEALTLLKTPTTNLASTGTQHPDTRKAGGHGPNLGDEVVHLDLGVYAAAIERWERVLGRPAPDPTQPSPRTGGPQLAPPFVEWMMGLPEGWVSQAENLAARESGYRNARLSLLGDGVVPRQAEHAYRLCLDALTAERAA